jgi:hypothetical protein
MRGSSGDWSILSKEKRKKRKRRVSAPGVVGPSIHFVPSSSGLADETESSQRFIETWIASVISSVFSAWWRRGTPKGSCSEIETKPYHLSL